jgi:hypothetical protein
VAALCALTVAGGPVLAAPAHPAAPLGSIDFAHQFNAISNAKPGIASCNGKLYVAWTSNTSPYHIYISRSPNPTSTTSWTTPQKLNDTAQQTTGPSLVYWKSLLYIAWAGTDGATHLYVGYYTDGSPSLSNHKALPDSTLTTPDIAPYSVDGRLYIVWRGTNNTHLNVESSLDGLTWGHKKTFTGTSPLGPAIGEFKGTHGDNLYIAWHGTGTGIQWTWIGYWNQNLPSLGLQDHTNTGFAANFEPDLVAVGSLMYIVFGGTTSSGPLATVQSPDGTTWGRSTTYDEGNHVSATDHAGKIWVAYIPDSGLQWVGTTNCSPTC